MDLSTAIKLKSSNDKIQIDNHFKLCAGPGAGKTSFLINHINNILSHSTRLSKSRRVACITYTNTGVETILSRLNNMTNEIEVSTIHSFLYNHIVKPYLWLLDDIIFPLDKLDGHDDIKPGYTLLKTYKEKSNQNWITDNQKLSKA
ncbi:DNA helicase, partial [Bacillus thuringiensis]